MKPAFLLDTDALAEPVKPEPHAYFMYWLKEHSHELATAAPVWHELTFGCARLPVRSVRRRLIEAFLNDVVRPTIPVLPYDFEAAAWHGRERARLTRKGRPPPFVDGQIASIASANDLTIVTGNARDYMMFVDLKTIDWRTVRD